MQIKCYNKLKFMKRFLVSKKKSFIIATICLVCVLVATTFGAYFGVKQYNKNIFNFTIEDTLSSGDGKSARVVLLAGQSNASGCSITNYLSKNVSEEKFAEYQNGYENIYINYYSSGNNISNGFVKTSTNQGETLEHFGPEVGLAEKLHEMAPDETIFILKFAWGATDLYSQWLSPSSKGKTGYLYKNFVRFVSQNMKYLKSKGYNAKIEGICWMQGESDSFFVETAKGYETNLKNFINDSRKKFSKFASSDDIGFVDAFIADNPIYWVYCDLVNQSKQAVANLSNKNVVIDTNANGLVCNQEPEGSPDLAHYDSLSQIKLGNLFAQQVVQFFDI